MSLDSQPCVACGARASDPPNVWGQRIHAACSPAPVCEGCTAWIEDRRAEALPDGRLLCHDCLKRGVWEPESARLLLEHTFLQLRELGLRSAQD
ncbi:MAG: hypothetical protein JKY65_24670 [Planctomycetes bacterium]|nr:hypothetical protein [Planctomycetota bacterium]